MESLEDDAGAASSVSRRVSAREKEIAQMEESNAGGSAPYEGAGSCDDHFDGDSVESPSGQDVNTSTEAILDMIDEFVDGFRTPREPLLDVHVKALTATASRAVTLDEITLSTANLQSPPQVHESNPSETQTEPPAIPSADSETLPNLECQTETVRSPVDTEKRVENEELPQESVTVDTVTTSEVNTPVQEESVNIETSQDFDVDSVKVSANAETSQESQVVELAQNTAGVVLQPETLPIETEKSVKIFELLQESAPVVNTDTTACPVVLSKTAFNNANVESSQKSPSDAQSQASSFTSQDAVVASSETLQVQPAPSLAVEAPSSCETVNTPSSSESHLQERTVKCVTSSESIDLVTVESAESTSSDSTVSAQVTRSPLKRHLVRPARPDTTVSSTVDSQINSPQTPQSSTSESVAKDVSSSSDAIVSMDDSLNEAISQAKSLSEVSVCKAETSVSIPRKIKLIRNKPFINRSISSESTQNQISHTEQCQSSSDPGPSTSDTCNSSSIDTSSLKPIIVTADQVITDECTERNEPVEKLNQEFISKPNSIPQEVRQLVPPAESIPSVSIFSTSETDDKKNNQSIDQDDVGTQLSKKDKKDSLCNIEDNREVQLAKISKSTKPLETLENTSSIPELQYVSPRESTVKEESKIVSEVPETNVTDHQTSESLNVELDVRELSSVKLSITEAKSVDVEKTETDLLQEAAAEKSSLIEIETRKVPPIKLNLIETCPSVKNTVASELSVSTLESEIRKVPPIKLNLNSTNSDSNKNESNRHSENDFDDRKVPPIKLSLTTSPVDSSSTTRRKASSLDINDSCNEIKNRKVPPIKLNLSSVNSPDSSPSDVQEIFKCDTERRKVPPIKLNLNVSSTSETPRADPSRKIESMAVDLSSIHEADQRKVPPIRLNLNCTESTNDDKKTFLLKEVSTDGSGNDQRKVPPIKLNLFGTSVADSSSLSPRSLQSNYDKQKNDLEDTNQEHSDNIKHVPKLTIKISGKQTEESKSPVSKLTIKPLRQPTESLNEDLREDNIAQIPSVTKLNIKPITKPPEKVNDLHRKSSSSEISESECSENDDSASTSDQASASEQGQAATVPKVTIKLGKPGTDGEGQFYMEKTSKFTIRPVPKTEKQQHSSKLTIKPIKQPEFEVKEQLMNEKCEQVIEDSQVPKITVKPVLKLDSETVPKTSKRLGAKIEENDNIPFVTKLNIKPVTKPTECSTEIIESSVGNISVISKLNIKPIPRPKDTIVETSKDLPKLTKLNIKALKSPDLEVKESDHNVANEEKTKPVVTKLNIKPIVRPTEEENLKEGENQSSETGNSSEENIKVPVVTKLNIKPIVKPNDIKDGIIQNKHSMAINDNVPVVMKLNIKPLVKPEENASPTSPMSDNAKSYYDSKNSDTLPIVAKLNIKPVVKPNIKEQSKSSEVTDESTKNPPLLMKITKNRSDITQSDSPSSNKPDQKLNSILTRLSSQLNKKQAFSRLEQNEADHISGDVLVNSTSKETTIENSSENLSIGDSKITLLNCLSRLSDSRTNENKCKETNCIKDYDVEHNASLNNDINHLVSEPTKSKSIGKLEENLQDTLNEGPNDSKRDLVHKNLLEVSGQTISQNCTLLKKLLGESPRQKFGDKNAGITFTPLEKGYEFAKKTTKSNCDTILGNFKSEDKLILEKNQSDVHKTTEIEKEALKQDARVCDNVTKPLEIDTSNKILSSGEDSPRIILKINKTDHGTSSEIITEEVKKSEEVPSDASDNAISGVRGKQNQRKSLLNSNKKEAPQATVIMAKRLRSSKVTDAEITPLTTRNAGKRTALSENSQAISKETETPVLESKRLRLGELLSNNSVTLTPVLSTELKTTNAAPTENHTVEITQGGKSVTNSILNNQNFSKNGNSKLHKILSNLQAKQMQAMSPNETNSVKYVPELESTNASTGSSDVVEVVVIENSNSKDSMKVNESPASHDFAVDESAQDPLGMETHKASTEEDKSQATITIIPEVTTPQPKKRGRPRKVPLSEPPKPVVLPVPALEERPQRSLRLSRERPPVVAKPRGRGRGRGRGIGRGSGRGGGRGGGRGAKRLSLDAPVPPEPSPEPTHLFIEEQKTEEEIDPTSSRIKLPRMTEALDKMPSVSCSTPLTSRRRLSSGTSDVKLDGPELKVVLENAISKELEETLSSESFRGPRGGRGYRGRGGGRGRTPLKTPRIRGRGKGGGRGATYMKETMGIYGRVCGPATTTVHLFEEETCMMDDNATPAKPTHLLDEDSQSSVKSSTNESSKMKKSKFEDLFDSNKLWTAADVKEYTWPPPESPCETHQVMMIQEQVAMFLSVKSFKRRYPELKRRSIVGEEKDYVLSRELVPEALFDLGVTAVDASEVLDIMLSDYPHKYEEYRVHQRERQLTEPEPKPQPLVETRVEIKVEAKPEPPKVDPEKLRQELALAAIQSAADFNSRLNALRKPACVDLQSMIVHTRRAPAPPPPPPRCLPAAGLYPVALLPVQYQNWCRRYTPEELRYFPLNTALDPPPPPDSPADCSSESEGEWGSDSSSERSDAERSSGAKRRKLTKVKRGSDAMKEETTEPGEAETEEGVELCRVCSQREERNRKHANERFLVCGNCNAKLHPQCVDLTADTIRKCREYAWQCADCKSCHCCQLPKDDDKMFFCALCDRGFHIYCLGLPKVPDGRWHCVECAICKSCGARDPAGLPGAAAVAGGTGSNETPDWQHQTKRGPGGHKVYSHSLCMLCASKSKTGQGQRQNTKTFGENSKDAVKKAYRIGRYCPICERSFIGPKGTMQLVICKLCDRQLHQDCVKQTVSNLNVLDYTCSECRRGGITSRSAAIRVAPRTIATLFMAKRRFNKYEYRKYMASRMQEKQKKDADDSIPEAILPDDSCEPIDESCDALDDPLDTGPDDTTNEEARDVTQDDEAANAVRALQMDFGD